MNQCNLAEQYALNENKLVKHGVNVHKFGGSSLANVACINRVVDIISKNCQLNDIVVVSANGDTTDQLFALLSLAQNNVEQIPVALLALQQQQQLLIDELLPAAAAQEVLMQLQQDIEQLALWLTHAVAQQNNILALGELWSARLLSALLNSRVCPSYYLDARDFLIINNAFECIVDEKESATRFRQLQKAQQLVVVTGYIAKDVAQQTCTLGRNGSDYSATIMAALTQANNVTLWTDVDGIYSADPRIVPNSRKLHRLPNEVAKELGRLGNPVLHAKTLKPLTDKNIHLHVASSFDAQVAGTEIGHFGQIAQQELSVTFLNELVLVQADSLKGERAQLAVQLFNGICANSQQGFVVIKQENQPALIAWLTDPSETIDSRCCAIIAVVGYNVADRGDVKARFKRSLNNNAPLHLVNNASQHSLIAILADHCTVELLNHVHHQVTKEAKQIGLVVAGLGNIGQRFLDFLPAQLNQVAALENAHLVALLSSNKILINNDGIEAKQALSLFEQQAVNYQQNEFLEWLNHHPYDELVIIDITPSEAFSRLYVNFFQQGIHVIGANKWAAASDSDFYHLLIKSAQKNHCLWLGNTTVGAGLPVNYAIKDLLNSGDTITEISGIFSGTLSWLFEKYDGSKRFSELLIDALAQGLTEPDPREDLSGRDVQRKLLILARLAGFNLSLADIQCQNLVPEFLQSVSKAEFLTRVNELDDFFAAQLAQANAKQACIRYIAQFKVKKGHLTAEVKLAELAKDHAFAKLTPCDNIFQIKSQWYQESPLIIRGPGAGRDVTAGGLHSDLVSICQQLASKKTPVTIKGINE